jgi:hypothetical protein
MALNQNRLQRLSAAVAAFNNRIAAVKQEAIEEAVQEAAATIPSGGGGGVAGVSSFNTRTGSVTLSSTDVTTALGFTPVTSYNDLSNKPTLFSGSYSDLTNKPTLFSGSYNDLTNAPSLVSEFTNDAGYITTYTETDPIFEASAAYNITNTNISNWNSAYSWEDHSTQGYVKQTDINAAIANLVDSAPTTLDTLNELAAALGDDPNFATTITTAIGLKANSADLSTVATTGSYNDLTNKPTLFSGSYNDLTDKPSSSFSGSYNDLTDKPTLTNGTVTSVSGTGTVSGLTLSGTVTSSGNITLDGTLSVSASNFSSQSANTFLVAPNGSSGVPTFRTIVAADIPTLNQNTTGSAASVSGTTTTAVATSALASGTASSSTFLRGDRTWAALSVDAATTTIRGTVFGISQNATSGASYYDNTGVGFSQTWNTSSGTYSNVAIGNNTSVSGNSQRNVIIGKSASTVFDATDSVSIGASAISYGNSVAIGGGARADFPDSVVLGRSARSQTANCVTIGSDAYTWAQHSTVIGYGAKDGGYSAVVINGNNGSNVFEASSTGFFVPGITSGTTSNVLYFDSTTKKITFGSAPSGGGVTSVAGKTGVVTLVKGDVGLGNADNTADASKSVASAAQLTTARTIGGVSFNGTTNIDLPGVNTTGNQNTSGSAASLSANLPVSRLNSGTNASSSTYWRGDGTWASVSAAAAWGSITGTLSSQTDLQNALNAKQNTLVSGTSIKTINGTTILGSGDIVSGDVTTSGTQTLTNKTISGGVYSNVVDVTGSVRSSINSTSSSTIDCSLANYFTRTVSSNTTYTFSNPPSSKAYAFTLEITHTSGTIQWPTTVRWPEDAAPNLTTGRTHLFVFVTDDGGSRWRGSALANYQN